MKILTEEKYFYSSLSQSIEVWVEDVLFISKILEKMNSGTIQTQFKHKLALEKGIGLIGHSFGGTTAILANSMNKHFTCAINIDGGMVNGLNERYHYKKPYMLLYCEYNEQMNRYHYTISKNDSYSLCIKNTTHVDFSDTSYFFKNLLGVIPPRYGTIDSDLMITITNDYVLSFFNKYIKRTTEKTLESNPYETVTFDWHQ